MIAMEVLGVRIELPANQPLVLLKETHGERHLPIWIGAPEASAIALAQQGIVPPRPMTHDLMVSVIGQLGAELTQVHIIAVRDAVFYAQLVFGSGVTVSSRASDAIALAIRVDCPILCTPEVLDDAGVQITEAGEVTEDDDEAGGARPSDENAESELRRFRQFLDDVEPEDFEN